MTQPDNTGAQGLREALRKIANLDDEWGTWPENNPAWAAMAIVTARLALAAEARAQREVHWYEGWQAACAKDHGPYDDAAPLVDRLRWWVPKSAQHGPIEWEVDLREAADTLVAAEAHAQREPACAHPSWSKVDQFKIKCEVCGEIGEEIRALRPDALYLKAIDGLTDDPAADAPVGGAQREPVLPHPGSSIASAMMDSVLAEYNWPSNHKNAARAGYTAAMRLLKQQEPAPMTDAIRWPKEKHVERHGDMGEKWSLRVTLDSDNDVIVSTSLLHSVEFCNGMGGGGKSPRTRAALINLMSAIEDDERALLATKGANSHE